MKLLPWILVAILLFALYRQNQAQIQQATTLGSVDLSLHKTIFDIVGLIQGIKNVDVSAPNAAPPTLSY